MPLLPTYPLVRDAERTLQKDGEAFTEARQIGLGWEQCYKLYWSSGAMPAGGIPLLHLRGGKLELKGRHSWQAITGADVQLPARFRDFLAGAVRMDHASLAGKNFTVTGVDIPMRGVLGRHDLVGFFWDAQPKPGKFCVERKFVFGRESLDDALEKHKKDVLKKFRRLRCDGAGAAFAGQLLFVTHLDSTKDLRLLDTKVLWTDTGGDWHELRRKTSGSDASFEGIWSKCRGQTHRGQLVKQVSDFLQLCGQNHRFPKQRVHVWTSRGAGMGLRMAMFVKRRSKIGSGDVERWYASKNVLRTVWTKKFAPRRGR